MKIDVITLHRVRNYGSSLQTFAMQKFLEKNGCDAEIIDYYPKRYSSLGLLKRLKYKSKKLECNPILLLAARIIISISYIKKKIVFDSFLKKYIKLSKKTSQTKDNLKADFPKADAYCTGSDQVWNSYWNEGIDTPFYLDFVPDNAYRFSYAASIGSMKLNKHEAAAVFPMLKKYQHITVRENAGVDVVKSLGLEAVQVLDPTLLFTAKDWFPYSSDCFSKKKYVVTYNLHHDKRIDQCALQLANKYEIKLFNISYNVHDIVRPGKLLWCPSIEEYLGVIKDAQYVVTDSFHATVFSILFHVKFIVIYPEKASSRIRSLLTLLHMDGRGFDKMPAIELIENEIDFGLAEEILQAEREKSQEYISMVLREIETSC